MTLHKNFTDSFILQKLFNEHILFASPVAGRDNKTVSDF